MADRQRVLAIVLNWRQPAITVACVRALATMDGPPDILVVDNGSGTDTIDRLRAALPDVELLALPENRGFAGGMNAGLAHARHAGYPYALLINNDAFAAPDMLRRLLAETAPDIALLSPKIYDDHAPGRLWLAGGECARWTLDLRGTGRGQWDSPEWATTHDVAYVLGTCLLVNLAATAEVGLLDERYFMYFEDLDWSLRLRAAGYRLRLVADAHLAHRVAASSGGLDTPARRYHLARSGVLFWTRHAAHGRPGIILLFRLASGLKMVTRLLLTGRPAAASAYLRGLRDGWRAREMAGASP